MSIYFLLVLVLYNLANLSNLNLRKTLDGLMLLIKLTCILNCLRSLKMIYK